MQIWCKVKSPLRITRTTSSSAAVFRCVCLAPSAARSELLQGRRPSSPRDHGVELNTVFPPPLHQHRHEGVFSNDPPSRVCSLSSTWGSMSDLSLAVCKFGYTNDIQMKSSVELIRRCSVTGGWICSGAVVVTSPNFPVKHVTTFHRQPWFASPRCLQATSESLWLRFVGNASRHVQEQVNYRGVFIRCKPLLLRIVAIKWSCLNLPRHLYCWTTVATNNGQGESTWHIVP